MIASILFPKPRQRFAWVLWLALLVPLAQLAAALHVQSHWSKDSAPSLEHKAALADACGQCVAVSSLAAGGAVSHTPSTAVSPAPLPRPAWASTQSPSFLSVAGYRSRAPPAASH